MIRNWMHVACLLYQLTSYSDRVSLEALTVLSPHSHCLNLGLVPRLLAAVALGLDHVLAIASPDQPHESLRRPAGNVADGPAGAVQAQEGCIGKCHMVPLRRPPCTTNQ